MQRLNQTRAGTRALSAFVPPDMMTLWKIPQFAFPAG